MKILVVGYFEYEIYEKAFVDAFRSVGCSVDEFRQNEYFVAEGNIVGIYKKFQNKYHIGPCVSKMNNDLMNKCQIEKYDMVFIYRGIIVKAETIKMIRASGAVVMGYNNDDPFGKDYAKYFWRIFLDAVKEYDFVFAYREKNIKEYEKIGYNETELLRAYYIKTRNFSLKNCNCDRYKADVIFVGHYENDGRDEYMHELLNCGIDFKIFGSRWSESGCYKDFCRIMGGKICAINEGKEYNLAINSCKIAIVFLSKTNNDTYTRRCFEIPATGKMMLCEYTEDMEGMFQADEEAVYFCSKEEFISKIKYYLKNEEERERIARNGYERLIRDGHEARDRVIQVLERYNKLKESATEG